MADSVQTDTLTRVSIECVPVDFAADDIPQPCDQCPEWHSEIVTTHEGPALREWHLPTCSVYLQWAE